MANITDIDQKGKLKRCKERKICYLEAVKGKEGERERERERERNGEI